MFHKMETVYKAKGFAEVLKVPVDKLLSQLDEAGIKVPDSAR